MLTPKQLFELYSTSPCENYLESPYSHLSANDVFGDMGPYGAGTPYNFTRIINFLRWVKSPCGSTTWYLTEDAGGIKNTGKGKLAPMYKLLQSLDAGAYTESQQRVRAGTAHSVRNTCDLARAAYLTNNTNKGKTPGIDEWNARMATEYLEYFAYNSLPDCLMMCGPDLVGSNAEAMMYRAPGYGFPTDGEPYDLNGLDDDGSILQKVLDGAGGGSMSCFPHLSNSVPGKAHGCVQIEESVVCRNCDICPTNPVTGDVIDPDDPCCRQGTFFYYNECCLRGNAQSLLDFSYWVPSDDGSFDGTINGGRIGEEVKHVGLVERRMYNGACNFDHQSSLDKILMTFPDYFLTHFQGRNGWNYITDSNISWNSINNFNRILRARTISLILDTDNLTHVSDVIDSTNADNMLVVVKDLLWNGYGVLLFSNVGFNNTRDSNGLSYPDRIFYTTYSIIGYDDTKTEYNECVYILHCPFGDWNSGGHPSWGPLPTGAFLVTETILKCMIQYHPGYDFAECRPIPCTLPIETYYRFSTEEDGSAVSELVEEDPCLDPAEITKAAGCGADESGCAPYWCSKEQRAFGMLFAISLTDDFKKQKIDIDRFYNYENLRQKIKSQKMTIDTGF
jgi:hypothetical protein